MKAEILAIGKCRDKAIIALVDEYLKRLQKKLPTTVVECKDEADLQAKLKQNKSGISVILDERGVQLSSRELAQKIQDWELAAAPVVQFAIGGADGHSAEVREQADFVLGISNLVLPHMLVRVIIAEQIYRAVSLNSGHPYHRD